MPTATNARPITTTIRCEADDHCPQCDRTRELRAGLCAAQRRMRDAKWCEYSWPDLVTIAGELLQAYGLASSDPVERQGQARMFAGGIYVEPAAALVCEPTWDIEERWGI